MSMLLPYAHVVRTVQALKEQVLPDSGNARQSVKTSYQEALNAFQKVVYEYDEDISIVCDTTKDIDGLLIASGGIAHEEVGDAQFELTVPQRTRVHELFSDSFETLERVDSTAYAYTQLLIHMLVICNAKRGGGSLAQNLGLVWFSPKKHWTVEYMTENLYHEALHQALFLEDMVHGIFGDVAVLNNPKYQVTSNFLHVKRPFDMAFHGVFVAAELMRFYEKQGNIEKMQSFMPELTKSIKEMDAVLEHANIDGIPVLTSHGETLYRALCAYVASIER